MANSVMVVEDDWITPPECIKSAAELIPNSKYHVLPDCSHMIFLDQPNKYYGLVSKYIAQFT